MKKKKNNFNPVKPVAFVKNSKNDDDEKVRDHYHITGNFRGASHWNWNINIQLTKKIPVIFHNSRGYDSHLVFCVLNKFDSKIDVILNMLEKYMTFFLNKNVISSKSLSWQYAMYEF